MTERPDSTIDTQSFIQGFQAGFRSGVDFAATQARISVRDVYPDDPRLVAFEAEFQQALDKYGKAA